MTQGQAAHKMSRFPPQPDVLRPVKMTRTAYAQLRGQKFHPPKIFGRWSEREESVEWRRRDVGMKIVGFITMRQINTWPSADKRISGVRVRDVVAGGKEQDGGSWERRG